MTEEFENDGPYQDAQSVEELERYVMGSTFPKTPAEWWACREIKELRDRLSDLDAENIRLKKLLNDGHSSLMKENEQLKWACAAKDARAALNGEKG